MRSNLTSVVQSVFVALGWVLLGLGSLASTAIALWIVVSLAKAAAERGGGVTSSTPWLWCVAVGVTLGVPFTIAVWKHHRDSRQISLTMAWLPMVWNACGLLLAAQLVPDIVGSALRGYGAWVAASQFGDSHSTTRVLSALGHHTADLVAPEPTPSVTAVPATDPALALEMMAGVDRDKAMRIPFTEEGTAILMTATLEGDGGRLALPYLYDTGASFTTISSETARTLGVEVPEHAPILVFNTASGPRESRMVYLPALELGEVRIEGLLVSVCDGCVNDRHHGLLGHNVMREFITLIDNKNQRMLLLPRTADERPNRAYDVEPVAELKVEGAAELWLGRVRWKVSVRNRGSVAIHDVVPVVKFADGPSVRGKPIDVIAAGEVGHSLVEGKASIEGKSQSSGHYTLGLAQAYW